MAQVNLDRLDTPGGHLVLSFGVFLVGVGLMVGGNVHGWDVVQAGLLAMGISMRGTGAK